MFNGCNNIINLTLNNLANRNLSCNNMLSGCSRLTTLGFSGKTHKESARKVIDVLNNYILEGKESTLNLSKKVDKANNDIEYINNYQDAQDNEILMNMLASADIFEMIVYMTSSQGVLNLQTKEKSGGNKMVELYVSLIVKGKKDKEDVPLLIRPQVEEMLKDLGIEVK